MRIFFLTSSLESGGAERVATTLCNAWASRGDEVTLVPTFLGGGIPFYEVSENVEIVYLADVVGVKNKNILSYAKRIFALRSLVSDKESDVIISFLPNVNVAAILFSVGLRIPLIICERRDPSSQPCSSIWEFACKLTYRFADMLTVQSESVEATVIDVYPGLRKVRSIPNPLPESILLHQRKEDNGRKVLLSLGRLSDEKQIEKIINIFSDLSSQHDDWDLHVYGDGPLKLTLENQVNKLQMQDRIILKGRTNNPWDVMAAADVFVMASKFEGFPNALLEAMAVGLPCVVYDCPSGPQEITQGGVDAVLVPLNDEGAMLLALDEIMGDEVSRITLGARARESVLRRFQLATVIGKWDELFKEVGVSV